MCVCVCVCVCVRVRVRVRVCACVCYQATSYAVCLKLKVTYQWNKTDDFLIFDSWILIKNFVQEMWCDLQFCIECMAQRVQHHSALIIFVYYVFCIDCIVAYDLYV